MPNQTDGPIRSNRRWTPSDDDCLRMLYPDRTIPIETVADLLDAARSQIRPNGNGGVVLTRADHEMVLRQLDRADEILLDCLG